MERKLFVCRCCDISHQFTVGFYPDYDIPGEVIIEIHLSPVSIWRRIKYAFHYILGKRSQFGNGAFGEILLDKKQTKELIQTLENFYFQMNSSK
jgi:hypothetical protein